MAKRRKMKAVRKTLAKTTTLSDFFREIWQSPKLLSAYNEGGDQRMSVFDSFKLRKTDRTLLNRGCLHEIVKSLVAGKRTKHTPLSPQLNNTVAYGTSVRLACKHSECQAYTNAINKKKA